MSLSDKETPQTSRDYTLACMQDRKYTQIRHAFVTPDPLMEINPAQTDLFLQTELEEFSQPHTLLSLLFCNNYTDDVMNCLHFMKEHQFTPEQAEKAFCFDTIREELQKRILTNTSSDNLTETNIIISGQKKSLDKQLAVSAQLIGAKKLIGLIFKDKIPADFKLHEPYQFENKNAPALMPTDILIKSGLPKLAIELLKQTYAETKSQEALLCLSGGPYTRQALYQAYKNGANVGTAKKEVYDYLNGVIATDLFMKFITQRDMHFSWKQDFEQTEQTETSVVQNSTSKTTPENSDNILQAPLSATEKKAVQLDFMRQLFSPEMLR